METFVHEFVSPINRYKALCVRAGLNPVPVAIFEGRQCYIATETRTRTGIGRRYFNMLAIHFLDNGEIRRIGAAQFNRAAKNAPLPEAAAQ